MALDLLAMPSDRGLFTKQEQSIDVYTDVLRSDEVRSELTRHRRRLTQTLSSSFRSARRKLEAKQATLLHWWTGQLY